MTPTIALVIAGTALTTFAVKAAGPALLGGRELPPPMQRVVVLMAPALIAALVAVNAFGDEDRLHVGADTVGVAAAAVVMAFTKRILLTVLTAAGVTALLRLLAG
ncbi:MAG: AzlD domain-containing protein [Aeromicrobium erythreum]